MNSKLKKLVEAIGNEFQKAEKAYKNTKKSAQEISETSRTSWSAAGDRFHSEGAADLAKERYETVLALKNEIDRKGEKICFEYNNGTIFLVDNPILIKGLKIVSTKSPIGEKLINEKQ